VFERSREPGADRPSTNRGALSSQGIPTSLEGLPRQSQVGRAMRKRSRAASSGPARPEPVAGLTCFNMRLDTRANQPILGADINFATDPVVRSSLSVLDPLGERCVPWGYNTAANPGYLAISKRCANVFTC
jgi:hypothetical protein